jgi:phosphate ABC transporter phosphate-binding protein
MVSQRIYSIATVIAGIFLSSNLVFMSTMSVPALAATNIDGAGASFPAIFVDKLIEEYEDVRPSTIVSYSSVGSGAGISSITNELVHFGASDAPLSDAERAAAPGLLHFPETAGGVVAVVNIPGIGNSELRLTGKVLADIFENKIKKWNDAKITGLQTTAVRNVLIDNGAKDIIRAVRADSSGTTFVFTEYLSKVSSTFASNVGTNKLPDWPGSPLAGPQNPGVAAIVEDNDYSIGYVELAFAVENGLDVVDIKNKSNRWVEPTLSSISSAVKRYVANEPLPAGDESWKDVSFTNPPGLASYPIGSFSYFMFYAEGSDNNAVDNLTEARELKRFLNWVNGPGQSFAADLDYVPLPKDVKDNNKNTLKMMEWNGVQVPGSPTGAPS